MSKNLLNLLMMLRHCLFMIYSRHSRHLLYGLALMLFSFSTTLAQEIRGKVVGEDGNPIPGANIIKEGTAIGTTTNVTGDYVLNVDGSDAVLLISFIGYHTERIQVGNRTTVNVTLMPDIQTLSEVIVVGYGVQKKTSITSAVSTISSDEVVSRQAPNTISLLQGRTPGLQIIQNSAQPGSENNQIRIRGQGTFSTAGSNPLILIDGIEGNLELLNPNMIEDVSILKDAASAAIYGSRAANGVILVTTKKGKEGRLNIEYNYNYANQSPSVRVDRITNPIEYMELVNKAIDYSNMQPQWRYTDDEINMYRTGNIPTADWTTFLFRDAPMHKHFLNLNGGKDGTTFNVGFGILDQTGILHGTDNKRYDVQTNFRSNLGGRVTIGSNISMARSQRHETAFQTGNANTPAQLLTSNSSEDQMLAAYAAPPISTPVLPDGSGRFTGLVLQNKGGNKNPLAIANGGGGKEFVSSYLLFSPYISIKIIDGLSAEIKGAVRFEETMGKAFVGVAETFEFFPDANGEHNFSGTTAPANSMFQRNTRENQYTAYGTLNYTKSFAGSHNFNAMVGYQQESFRQDELDAFRTGFISKDHREINVGPLSGLNNGGTAFEWAMQSVFGRINYDFKNKYLFEASFRNDASSRFPTENQWAFFPSLSAGWRIAQESFFSNVNWVDELKLRGSLGKLGNQNIGNYPYQSALTSNSTTAYNYNGTLSQGLTLRELTNSNIRWESTAVIDIGIDFSIFKSKLYGSVDWYKKTTSDILRTLQVPQHVGLTAPFINEGIMENKGWEFLIGHRNKIGKFGFSIDANLETYTNRLVKFGAREISGVNLREEGLPFNQYYVLINDGVYQTQEEIDNGPTPAYSGNTAPKPGSLKFKDVSGPDGVPDGIIDLTHDRAPVEGLFPKFNYGMNLNADFKSFDLNIFIQGVHGRKTYVTGWGVAPFQQAAAPPIWWRDAWTEEAPSNTVPHIFIDGWAPNNPVSTFWLGNSSYFRVKNVQLGYTLPAALGEKIMLKNLRVYTAADNLFTHTKFFQGLDPERTASGSARAAIYPQATIYSFGITAIF